MKEKASQPKKKRTKGQIFGDVVIIIIIIALLATAGWLLYKYFFPNNTPVLKYQITEKDKSIDWAKLKEKNPDTVGWLSIDGTNIDTPIVQTTDNDRYLNTNFEGNYDQWGVPFLDCDYRWDPRSRSSVIYGHSNSEPTFHIMFDDLSNYVDDPEFIQKHGAIEYKRPPEQGGDGVYAIFAVLLSESDYDYRQMDFSGEDEFLSYYYRIRQDSTVKRDDVTVEPGDEILVLSTCIFTKGFEDGRLAIFAKRIS